LVFSTHIPNEKNCRHWCTIIIRMNCCLKTYCHKYCSDYDLDKTRRLLFSTLADSYDAKLQRVSLENDNLNS
jgi:hypothetical protein